MGPGMFTDMEKVIGCVALAVALVGACLGALVAWAAMR